LGIKTRSCVYVLNNIFNCDKNIDSRQKYFKKYKKIEETTYIRYKVFFLTKSYT